MKARKIHEVLYFTRGGNPYTKLGVGQLTIIQNWINKYLIVAGDSIDNYKIFPDFSIEIYDYATIDFKTIWIPDNIHFQKNFNVDGNYNLLKLPNGMVVTGSLDLRRSNITELPDDLVVGQKIYCSKDLFDVIPESRINWSYFNASPQMRKDYYYEVRLRNI